MSVVVGCTTCGKISQVPAYRTELACACGGERSLLLTVADNRERWRRGVPLAEWFDAPDSPATRLDCERGERPCPHLRCRYHLGYVGDCGCALDVADQGANTLLRTAELLGLLSRARVLQIERQAKALSKEAANDERASDRCDSEPAAPVRRRA